MVYIHMTLLTESPSRLHHISVTVICLTAQEYRIRIIQKSVYVPDSGLFAPHFYVFSSQVDEEQNYFSFIL